MRPGRRSVSQLFLNEFTRWVLRNKERLKGRNYWFKTLASLWGRVSDKSLKKLAQMLDGCQIDGIKLEVWKINGDFFVHFNPPDEEGDGYWLWLPVFRTVIEDVITLALHGRLIDCLFGGRPRLPFFAGNLNEEIPEFEEKPAEMLTSIRYDFTQ
jgi:hypothetical protein